MADTQTSNYAFILPEVGASTDTWGTKNNSNWSSVDTILDGIADTLLLLPRLALDNDYTGNAQYIAKYVEAIEANIATPLRRARLNAVGTPSVELWGLLGALLWKDTAGVVVHSVTNLSATEVQAKVTATGAGTWGTFANFIKRIVVTTLLTYQTNASEILFRFKKAGVGIRVVASTDGLVTAGDVTIGTLTPAGVLTLTPAATAQIVIGDAIYNNDGNITTRFGGTGTPATLSQLLATANLPSTANFRTAAVAAMGFGQIGSFGVFNCGLNVVVPGTTIAGSLLRWSNANGDVSAAAAPAGTWEAQGGAGGSDSVSARNTTLFRRVA